MEPNAVVRKYIGYQRSFQSILLRPDMSLLEELEIRRKEIREKKEASFVVLVMFISIVTT
jgi:hypothetical protein